MMTAIEFNEVWKKFRKGEKFKRLTNEEIKSILK